MKARAPHQRSPLKDGSDLKQEKTVEVKDERLPELVGSVVLAALEDLAGGLSRSDKQTSTHTVKAYKVGNMLRIDIIPRKET